MFSVGPIGATFQHSLPSSGGSRFLQSSSQTAIIMAASHWLQKLLGGTRAAVGDIVRREGANCRKRKEGPRVSPEELEEAKQSVAHFWEAGGPFLAQYSAASNPRSDPLLRLPRGSVSSDDEDAAARSAASTGAKAALQAGAAPADVVASAPQGRPVKRRRRKDPARAPAATESGAVTQPEAAAALLLQFLG